MKLDDLQRKLMAVAKANPPSDRVPLAFEKRIMALIRSRPRVDHWASWARALWCAAAPCVAIMLLASAWVALNPATDNASANGNAELSQQFDTTMLAAVDQVNDASW